MEIITIIPTPDSSSVLRGRASHFSPWIIPNPSPGGETLGRGGGDTRGLKPCGFSRAPPVPLPIPRVVLGGKMWDLGLDPWIVGSVDSWECGNAPAQTPWGRGCCRVPRNYRAAAAPWRERAQILEKGREWGRKTGNCSGNGVRTGPGESPGSRV